MKQLWKRRSAAEEDKQNAIYKNPDDDPRGPWTVRDDLSARKPYSRAGIYAIANPVTDE